MKKKYTLFALLVLSGTAVYVTGSCNVDPLNCQGDALRHIPDNTKWYLNVTTTNTLHVVGETTSSSSINNVVILQKISRCRIYASLENGENAVTFVVSKRAIFRACSPKGLHIDAPLALLTNVISALFSSPVSAHNNTRTHERDGFGICPTFVSTYKTEDGFINTRIRNLNHCISPVTGKKPITHNDVMTWSCDQTFYGDIMTDVKCQHEVHISNDIEYTGYLEVIFMRSHTSKPIKNENLDPIRSTSTWTDPSADIEQVFMGLCNASEALTAENLHYLPSLIATLSIATTENIVNLYTDLHNKIKCPANTNILSLLGQILKDTVSAEATEAKCRILHKIDSTNSKIWASSMGRVVSPTEKTLFFCAKLLDRPYWSDVILGLANMARNVREQSCVKWRRSTLCPHSKNFQKVSKKLWIAAKNCGSNRKSYVQTTLLALRGLQTISSDEHDVASTLITCATIAVYPEIAISTIKAMGHDKCSIKATEWLQMAIFNTSLDSEMRIEAFKSLLICDQKIAEDIVAIIQDKANDIKSNQLLSYVTSNKTSMHLSRTFEWNLSEIFQLKNVIKVRGDVLLSDSFVPRSLSLKLESDLLPYIAESFKISIRQNNAEELLKRLFGPAGNFENIPQFAYYLIQNIINKFKGYGDLQVLPTMTSQDFENLLIEGWLQIHIDNEEYEFLPVTVKLRNWNTKYEIQQVVSSWVKSVINFLISHTLHHVSSNNMRTRENNLWTFAGNILRVHEYEGIVALLDSTSQIGSILKPSVSASTKPSLGYYHYTSLHLKTSSNIIEGRTISTHHLGFQTELEIFRENSENYKVTLNLPSTTSHSFGKSNRKELIGGAYAKCKDCTHQKNSCNNVLIRSLGYNLCFITEKKAENGGSVVNEIRSLSKVNENESLLISVSSKNPGINSFFLSTLIEKIGGSSPEKTNLVIGLTYSPHMTMKIMAHGPDQQASFETSLVDDLNMKRFEMRSSVNKKEYGIKAELMMVHDGSMVSVKPRFVLSRPGAQEDSLFEGYISHYNSEKVRSLTVDFNTDGTLKEIYDVAFRGISEVRSKSADDWSLKIKNFRLISPEIQLGIETEISKNLQGSDMVVQIDWDREIVMIGLSMVQENPTTFAYDFHFINANRSHMDTRLSLSTNFDTDKFANNFTCSNGVGSTKWDLKVIHSTVFHRLEYNEDTLKLPQDAWLYKSAYKLVNNIEVAIPQNRKNWKLDHTLFISNRAIENEATLMANNDNYFTRLNIYDQSEELFKYHIEIEMSTPLWRFVYIDTLFQRGNGDFVGQSVAQLPSGTKVSSSSRIRYKKNINIFLLDFAYDGLIQNDSEQTRIKAGTAFENTESGIRIWLGVSNPQPLLSVNMIVNGKDSIILESKFELFVRNLVTSQFVGRWSNSMFDISSKILLEPYDKEISNQISLYIIPYEWTEIRSLVSWQPIKDPVTPAKSLELISNMKKETSSSISTRCQITFEQKLWSVEMTLDVGRTANKEKRIVITLQQPERDQLEASSSLLIDKKGSNLVLQAHTVVFLSSKVIYQLLVDGKTKLDVQGSEALLKFFVNTPFTKKITFNTEASKQSVNNKTSLTIKSLASSEAGFWNTVESYVNVSSGIGESFLHINLRRDQSFDMYVKGQLIPKRLEAAYSYSVSGNMDVVTDETKQNFNLDHNGQIQSASSPTTLIISQVTSIEKNKDNILQSEGHLEIVAPRAKGSLRIKHAGNTLKEHSYRMTGKFTGTQLESKVTGNIDSVPVRGKIHFADGKRIRVGGSYGGKELASIGFETELDRMILGISLEPWRPSKIATTGFITWKGKKTRFLNVIRSNKKEVSSILRIKNLQNHPLKMIVTREQISNSHFTTKSELNWGIHNITYEDDISLKNLRELDINVKFSVPSSNLKDIKWRVQTQHIDNNDQEMYISYSQHNLDIYRGRFTGSVLSNRSQHDILVSALISDLILNELEYPNINLKQAFKNEDNSLLVKSQFTKGNVQLLEFILELEDNNELVLIKVCRNQRKCFRVLADGTFTSGTWFLQHYGVDIEFRNNILAQIEDNQIQHHLTVFGSYKDPNRVVANMTLMLEEIPNFESENLKVIGRHGINLISESNVIDVSYSTINRTVVLKCSKFQSDTNEHSSSNLIQLQLWLDYDNKPKNYFEWNTTYAMQQEGSVEHVLSSSLNHRLMSRPMVVEAHLVSHSCSDHKFHVVIDVFKSHEKTTYLDVLTKRKLGRSSVSAVLKRKNGEEISSLEANMESSPVNGKFNINARIPPRLSKSVLKEISLDCSVQVDLNGGLHKCKISSNSLDEEWYFITAKPDDVRCIGLKIDAVLFKEKSALLAQSCRNPFLFQANISPSGPHEESLKALVGTLTPNTLTTLIPGLSNVNISLHSPFVLQLSSGNTDSITETLNQMKVNVKNHIKFLVSKTKNTARTLSAEFADFERVHAEFLSEPSLINEFADIMVTEIYNSVHEMNKDPLVIDIKEGVHDSINYLSSSFESIISAFNETSSKLPSWSLLCQQMNGVIWKAKEIFIQSTYEIYRKGKSYLESMKSTVNKIYRNTALYVAEKLSIMNIRDWIKDKIQEITSWRNIPSLRTMFTKLNNLCIQVLSFFYKISEVNYENFNVLIPLPTSSYTLSDVIALFRWQKTKDSYRSLYSEFDLWKQDLQNPLQFVKGLLSPSTGYASYNGDSIQTFDGHFHEISPQCRLHLLTSTYSQNSSIHMYSNANDFKKLALHVQFDGREILIGPNLINIDGKLVSMPYTLDGIKARQSLSETSVSYRKESQIIFKVICNSQRPTCIIKINGWVLSGSFGLLVNSDGKEDEIRDFSMATNYDSQGLCNTTTSSQHSNELTEICHRYFKDLHSPLVPCYDSVQSNQYFDLCTKKKSNHNFQLNDSASENFQTTYHFPKETVRLNDLDIPLKEQVCDSVTAYKMMCYQQNSWIKPLEDCHSIPKTDILVTESLSVDLLVLIEQSKCANHIYNNLIKPLPELVKQIAEDNNISVSMGAIMYANSEEDPTYITTQGEFLSPPQIFKFPPKMVKSGGSLEDLLKASQNYPYRHGTMRIVFIASCSHTDISEISEEMVSALKRQRIILYTLAAKNIILEKTKRNQIVAGLDSRFIYHIRRKKVFLKTLNGTPKVHSNIGRLALQTGGGVFSWNLMSNFHNTDQLLMHFRKILINAMVYVARDYYDKSPSN